MATLPITMRKFLRTTIILFGSLLLPAAAFLLYIVWSDYNPPETIPVESDGQCLQRLGPDTLRLLSWNIGYAGLGREMDFFYDGGKRTRCTFAETLTNLEGIRNTIRKQLPLDFILLQEVDIASQRSYRLNLSDSLASFGYPYCRFFVINYDVPFVPMPLLNPMGKVKSGLLNLSAFSPAISERVSLQGRFGFPVYLFMPDRCYHLSRYSLNQAELVIVNTHNTAFDGGRQSSRQMADLRDLATEEYAKGNYVIMGGDFNLNPPGYLPHLIATGDTAVALPGSPDAGFFPEGWHLLYDPASPTNRFVDQPYQKGQTPVTTIDYFIASPNITPIRVKTLQTGFKYSDHEAVIIEVILNKF